MSTQGDRMLEGPLALIGGKGLFVREIEEALLRDEVDLAVHSMKDLPGELPPGLVLAGPPEREDPRDALVSRRGEQLTALPARARVGTSSLRRAVQLRAVRPDLAIVSVRGNVPTRVAKALDPPANSQTEPLDAVVLAAAGLRRLSLTAHITELFDAEHFVPAVGQGILALEHRDDDRQTATLLLPLASAETAIVAEAERALLRRLGAGCTVPLGAHARLIEGAISMTALVGNPETGEAFRFHRHASRHAAAELGVGLAEEMLQSPARALLAEPPTPGSSLAGFSS